MHTFISVTEKQNIGVCSLCVRNSSDQMDSNLPYSPQNWKEPKAFNRNEDPILSLLSLPSSTLDVSLTRFCFQLMYCYLEPEYCRYQI